MSQAGKILHLYVEVRSIADEEGKEQRDVGGMESLMLKAPDVLPQSQHEVSHMGYGSTPPPGVLHRRGSSTQSLTSSKSPSRHSVSFQLHPGEELHNQHHQSLPCDEISHLLSVLQSGPIGSMGNLVRARSTENAPLYGRESQPYGRFTAPPTPSGCRKAYGGKGQEEEGRRSVVSFSYIEKASVKPAGSVRNFKCQKEPENPFNRASEDHMTPPHLRKRLSDPVWYNSWESLGSSNPKLPCSTSRAAQRGLPNLRRATLDSIARDATHRAMEEFGSPQLRRRLAASSPDSGEGERYHEQLRCRSWNGSPALPRCARTLPVNANLMDSHRSQALHGLPRSPASDQLSAHARQAYYTMSSPTNARPTVASYHRPWQGDESPRMAYRRGASLPSCRPAAIQLGIPAMNVNQSPSNRVSHCPNDSVRSAHKVNFKLSKPSCSNKTDEGVNHLRSRGSVSPVNSPEVARKLAEEAFQLSTIFMEARRSPSPTPSSTDTARSDSPRSGQQFGEPQHYASFQGQDSTAQTHSGGSTPNLDLHFSEQEHVQTRQSEQASTLFHLRGRTSPAIPTKSHCAEVTSSSPIRDPRLERSDLLGKDSPILHRHQPPQYTGDTRSPGQGQRPYDTRDLKDNPENHRRSSMGLTTETPVSWTSQQQRWRDERSNRDRYFSNKENIFCEGAFSVASSKEHNRQKRGDSAVLGSQESQQQMPRGLIVDSGPDGEHGSMVGLSPSSSGVTGSLGESSYLDRDTLSPETASQKSSDTGNTASCTQSGSRSSLQGPSLHSQRIARAKWDFLFGASEDRGGRKDASSASSGGSSSESAPTPASSLPLELLKVGAGKAGNHDVHAVEMDLVAAHAVPVVGSPAKTGIIRRTIKYSETDLDAVPLRCYRETDLDEVMQAEQEEVDSAFSSNRSGPGTRTSSPLEGTQCSQAEEEEEEELPEDEEVVSWASVRMQGDKKRQNATQEEEEVFSRLLRGPLESQSDNHSALKSPITVVNPRRISADGLDSFSRHFESIMESHRAKGTSYTSLDSMDLTPSGPHVFTFDLPTLTPEIQSQICESARQIIELSFAPLARPEPSSHSDPPSNSEATSTVAGEDPCSTSEDKSTLTGSSCSEMNSTTLSDSALREKRYQPVSESDPEVAQRLALGSTDALANGNRADLQAAKRLAKRLFNLDGFRKSDVARHLSKNNDFSQMVAGEYLRFFNFSGMTLDQGLRVFLKEFALMGETQERERVLSHFSRRYHLCNPNTIPSEDGVHTLTCALMLLNTDLHGRNIGKRMSCMQFIGNLEGLNEGQDFPKDLLKALYTSIKTEKLQWTIDEEELRQSFSELADTRTDSASHTMKRISAGGNPLVSVAQQSNVQIYKNGFLVRKVHADPDGKRTPRGKRGWKSFYAILRGLVLYLQKGEYRPDKQLTDEDLKNAVSIHHSLAMRASDYSKRPNVFYLRTADWRVFLFQAPNSEQMQSWITRINTVAAMFSAPPFPAAIGSQKKFSRPLLPGSNTKLSQEEQVQSHETRFRAVAAELQELLSMPQDRKAKGRDQDEQKLREEYLEFEKTRYGTYAMLLRAKIRLGETDLAAFEAHLFDDGGLQRAHSSPTLPQDSSLASSSSGGEASGASGRGGRKSKRTDGQRQSYHQAVKP